MDNRDLRVFLLEILQSIHDDNGDRHKVQRYVVIVQVSQSQGRSHSLDVILRREWRA